MSKFKLSFSLILAVLLVGMLGTAAFAKDAYGLKAYRIAGTNTIKVDFNGTADDTPSTTAFTITVNNPDNTVLETKDITIGADRTASYTTPDLEIGKIYTVLLARQSAPTTFVSGATITISDAFNVEFKPLSPEQLKTTKINANETGFNVLKKNRTGHKTHGSYQNNTNSCASCHQTHTAEGDYLLFKDGTYNTCAACHDGTMGAKGVFGAPTNAGTFGGSHDGNMSIHMSDGSVSVQAAPGGNKAAGTGSWTEDFTCASCHEPHGSPGSKLLKVNPLGLGGVKPSDDPAGKKFVGVPVKDTVPATKEANIILSKYTVTADDIGTDPAKAKPGYKTAGLTEGTVILQTYKWNPGANHGAGGYSADYSLWLQEKGWPYKANTVIKDSAGTDITSQFNVAWLDGFISEKSGGKTIADVATADISQGIAVTVKSNPESLYNNYSADYVMDSGVQMSNFCSSCHADYLSGTYKNSDTGVYTTAHRHQTNTDMLTCSRCHFAHGTDATIMKDASNKGVAELTAAGGKFDPVNFAGDTNAAKAAAIEYLKDPNPSSALKKHTGMSVCYSCHGSGVSFINDPKSERP
ncbi:cytochrome c3 family protein [Mesobacillus zeae]|uniref:Doubled CXXCH motif domain-containing protein n=1 Tax=Mesobacillus zeae TaxID=1917180 RepID=A0A398B4Y5_9BACI|nr:cytochrome c3 family protein [Mesobacillus zeae]RID84877.1 hypothetical protein D1970_11045 [Mesobacillus zeae]